MSEGRKKRFSYTVRAVLATGVLYFALDLSAGDRGVVDYVVIGLVSAAIVYNLVRLGHRMYTSRGGRSLWHVQRTVLFWFIGLGNTVWARPEDVGTWRNWMGWGFVVLAVIDTCALFRDERSLLSQTEQTEEEDATTPVSS